MMDDSVGNDKSMVRQEGEYDDDEEKYRRQMEKTALMTCGGKLTTCWWHVPSTRMSDIPERKR